MTREILNFGRMVAMGLTIAVSAVSCNNDDSRGGTDPVTPTVAENFNVIYRVGHERNSDWAILPLTEAQMKSGSINFQTSGFVLPSTRTQQMYATNNGKNVFVYDAATKVITKYVTTGDTSFYKKDGELSVEAILGNASGIWKVMDDKNALIYGIYEDHQKDNAGNYTKTVATLKIGKIDLTTLNAQVSDVKSYVLENDTDQNDATIKNLHISAIGHPIVSNGKVYFGVAKRGYDGATAKNVNYSDYETASLVLDYPALTNPKVVKNANVKGASASPSSYYGLSYVNDNNSVYHIVPTNEGKILKLTNGAYDTSYVFDVKSALGVSENINVSGFYYAGSGVGYITYAPSATARAYANASWSVARVDLNAKTAIKMNVPEKLWLNFYQTAKLYNGKLYMPLCPTDAKGNIYIFDPTKASADGFEKGAELELQGGALYLGAF